MKTLKYFLLCTALLTILLTGCESLVVKNENDPNLAMTADPLVVRAKAGSLIQQWFQLSQNTDCPALMFWVGADAGTCSWGNYAMRDFSYEPRIGWNNYPSYSNALYNENFYKTLYAILSLANEVLLSVEVGDMEIIVDDNDETPMCAAVSHLTQGLCLGYLGLTYDKGFVVTEFTDLTLGVPTSPYSDLVDTALVCLDKCIAICDENTFTLPSEWIPGVTMTNVKLSQLANTVAAALLSYSPRNVTENDAVDWALVQDYADNGLTYDFAPVMDDINWYAYYHVYANYGGWGQADMRIINMMDPRFPARWTDANTWNTLPARTTTHTAGIDDRIFTDFNYMSSCPFRVERGYYHFSCYRFNRYDTYMSTWTEPNPAFTKVENDLLKAEARLHQAALSEAAGIINAGTRVTRGALAPVSTSSATAIGDAIFYERNIELYCTGFGLEFFTMRKANKLQAGTPLHLPIPGQQLEVNQMDYYTFGPGVGTAGVDYSNGGWF